MGCAGPCSWHGQTSAQNSKVFECDWSSYALNPLFAHTGSSLNYLNVSLYSLFRSFLKQPLLSPVQSQNTLPLDPIMCTAHLSSNPLLVQKVLWHWLILMGFGSGPLGWDSPGTALERALVMSLPQSLIWIPTCRFAVLLWACASGTSVGWWPLWWTWQGVVWASPAAIVSLSSFGGVQTSFYHII